MAATVLCASAAKSDKTHTHPETAEQERKQTLSTKRGPGDLRVYRASLPTAASQALALTDSPSESRRQGGDQEPRRK